MPVTTEDNMKEVVWLGEAIPINELPKVWLPIYHANGYLKVSSDVQLQGRIEDILSNATTLHDDRKYRPRFLIRDDGLYRPIRNLDFPRMLVEAGEEYRLRGSPPFQPAQRAKNLQMARRLANETWCTRTGWIEGSRLSQEEYQRPRMLFKFSETRYNRRLLAGEIYLRPASCYSEASLNNALADDELAKKWYLKHGIINAFAVADYYCLCMSATYDLRLFRDFREGDFSCVAIKNVPEFIRRLWDAVKSHKKTQRDQQVAGFCSTRQLRRQGYSAAGACRAGHIRRSTPSCRTQ
jgi:hypothetical protein